jgi:hypothetical protein
MHAANEAMRSTETMAAFHHVLKIMLINGLPPGTPTRLLGPVVQPDHSSHTSGLW